jgi:nicotinamide mononucleotide transporter
MYVFYGVFTAVGFVIWWRAQRQAARPIEILPPDPSPRRPDEEA